MFQINMNRLEQLASDMQWQIRTLGQAIGQTEDAISGLRDLSGMDAVIRKLRNEIAAMEEERKNLLDMTASLQEIAEIFRVGERSLIDYAEGTVRRTKETLQWNEIRFSENAGNILQQLIR